MMQAMMKLDSKLAVVYFGKSETMQVYMFTLVSAHALFSYCSAIAIACSRSLRSMQHPPSLHPVSS